MTSVNTGSPHNSSSLVSSGLHSPAEINYQNGNCFIPLKRLEEFPYPVQCGKHRANVGAVISHGNTQGGATEKLWSLGGNNHHRFLWSRSIGDVLKVKQGAAMWKKAESRSPHRRVCDVCFCTTDWSHCLSLLLFDAATILETENKMSSN